MQVNMVLNVHRNHKAYKRRGERGEGGMEVGEEGDGRDEDVPLVEYLVFTRMPGESYCC